MGGFFLIGSLIAIYLVVYWSIHIELVGDKTKGFLGFLTTASYSLHSQKKEAKHFLKTTEKTETSLENIKKDAVIVDKPFDKKQKTLKNNTIFLKNRNS